MTAITTTIDRQLAHVVRVTDRWKRVHVSTRRIFTAIDFFTRGLFYVWRNRRYLTFLKLANMALVNVQFLLKTERVVGRPYNMKIEPTNICNTKCQLCPTGIGLQGRPRGKMSFDRYRRLIDRLRWHLFGVDLSMWGDPLIVPEVYDMIRHAHDRGIWTYLSSNLHAFKPDKDQARKLVESGLDMLTCSLHGATQETFQIYQPGKRFADTVEKVRRIVRTRDAMGSRTPMVQLNFVVTRHNEHEREAFQRLADELGCNAVFSTASMNVRFLGQNKKLQPLGLAPDVLARKTTEHLRDWLPADSGFVLEPYQELAETGEMHGERYNGHKPFNCSWPWRQSVVNWDGQVVTCCGSFDPAEDMGSVFEMPFGKIWNGRKYRLARRSFKKKLTAERAKDNPCAECPGYML